MVSAYFKVKIKTEEFKNNIKNIIEQVKDKKFYYMVIIKVLTN